MDQLPRLGKRELICLLLFTCNYVVSVWRGFLFLWVLGMGYVILLWHSLSLPYNYSVKSYDKNMKYFCIKSIGKFQLGLNYVSHYETCPCNILQYFTVVKMIIFRRIFIYFSYCWSKHRLWVHVRTASMIYPCKPQFYYIKVGCKGVS